MTIRTTRFRLALAMIAASLALVGCGRSVTLSDGGQILASHVEVAMEAHLADNITQLTLTDRSEYDGQPAICAVATLPESIQHDVITLDRLAIAAFDNVQPSVPGTQAVGVVLRFMRADDSTWWEQHFDTREYWYACESGTQGEADAARDCITVLTSQDVARRLGDPGELEGEPTFIGTMTDIDAEQLSAMARGSVQVPDLQGY